MAQAIITLGEHEDRVLTIVKGKYGFKNKSDAVNFVIDKFEETFVEPSLRPEYKKELLEIDLGHFKKFSSIEQLRREIEHV